MSDLRRIPSVDRLLRHPDTMRLIAQYGREQVTNQIRSALDVLRVETRNGSLTMPDVQLITQVGLALKEKTHSSLVPVINATGVILHTNLGRAPFCRTAVESVNEVASGYSTLEYDLEAGERGARSDHVNNLLCNLTGAEDALVVNNNAGAVLLCLSALASRRKVIISRSQLVEIGGGFRIPEVMKQSGARLVEVGTTNRVNITDYESAILDDAAMVLRVHSSNFKLVGFTTQPTLKEIVDLSHRYHLPVLDDVGSGALLDTSIYGLEHEPMVKESIEAGADLVCFSGDKLLGGPQAGIIVGKKEYLQRIKRHPLARALRIDKLSLAALIATLRHYLIGDAVVEIPVWRMIAAEPLTLKNRVDSWRSAIGTGEVLTERSTIGGGSLPEETLPTFVLALDVPHVKKFVESLRQSIPPLICRVQNGRVLFDPRTVQEVDDLKLIEIIKQNLLRS